MGVKIIQLINFRGNMVNIGTLKLLRSGVAVLSTVLYAGRQAVLLYKTVYPESETLNPVDEAASAVHDVLKNQVNPELDALTLDEKRLVLEQIYSISTNKDKQL